METVDDVIDTVLLNRMLNTTKHAASESLKRAHKRVKMFLQ